MYAVWRKVFNKLARIWINVFHFNVFLNVPFLIHIWISWTWLGGSGFPPKTLKFNLYTAKYNMLKVSTTAISVTMADTSIISPRVSAPILLFRWSLHLFLLIFLINMMIWLNKLIWHFSNSWKYLIKKWP